MSRYSKEDILRLVNEEDVEFVRLQFTDAFGVLKNVAITASQLGRALDNKIMFDGASIDGFVRNQICICIRIWIHLQYSPGDHSRARWQD